MTTIYSFQTAGRIIAGNDSLRELKNHLSILGDVKKAAIITTPFFETSSFIELIGEQLTGADISYEVLAEIQPEPTVGHIEDVFASLSGQSFDLLIGLGGGSALDAAKILSVMSTNDLPLRDLIGTDKVEKEGIPTILIPTTSGTGSEVTPNAIVTVPEAELKEGVVSRYLLPSLVILDPVLTLTLPPNITAATGMDAFTHSFESFISTKANPISDMFAMESMRLISRSIITACEEGSNLEARHDMLMGSAYGGMALTSAGTAAVHALAYPLGGKFHIPHGEANSMLLPHVTRVNLDAIQERMALIAKEIGVLTSREASSAEAAEALITQIEEWTKRLNIPQNLKVFGIKEEDVEDLATAASKVTRLLNNNPKELTIADMQGIYRKLLK
ncbi:iron-containing alcohol dehydrogenase [Rossellomorea marisflavi]|uniref:iron-containing alcohol dehydrogenase n=1 Tax=Rossellomorea marisflavi TaxID=189381 RepID=UPI003457C071